MWYVTLILVRVFNRFVSLWPSSISVYSCEHNVRLSFFLVHIYEIVCQDHLVLVQRKTYNNDIIIPPHNRAIENFLIPKYYIILNSFQQYVTLWGFFSVAGNLGVAMPYRHPARAPGTVCSPATPPGTWPRIPGVGQGRAGQMASLPPYTLVTTGQISNQCWFDAGPASTLAQHQTSIGWTSRVGWPVVSRVCRVS